MSIKINSEKLHQTRHKATLYQSDLEAMAIRIVCEQAGLDPSKPNVKAVAMTTRYSSDDPYEIEVTIIEDYGVSSPISD